MLDQISVSFFEAVDKAFSALQAGGSPLLILILIVFGFAYILGKSHGSNRELQNKFSQAISKLDGLFGKLQRMENTLNSSVTSANRNFEVLKEQTQKSYERIKKIYKYLKAEPSHTEEEEPKIEVKDVFASGANSSEDSVSLNFNSTAKRSDTEVVFIEESSPATSLWNRIKVSLFGGKNEATFDFDNLKETLIRADVGPEYADAIAKRVKEKNGSNPEERLKDILRSYLIEKRISLKPNRGDRATPRVFLFVGVNGTGKTSTLGKMAFMLRKAGHKVLTIAADTFRAGAEEQLFEWSKKSGVDCYFDKKATKPQTVVFDGIKKALEEKCDFVLIDTAGRLHNKSNLMQELSGIKNVIQKQIPDQPEEIFLVLDATTGQTAFNQAKEFCEIVNVTSLILTKLDSSAKGGTVFRISSSLNLPISFVSVGEDLESLVPFERDQFVEKVLGA
ncbi:MAG: signal recognition particle-docking protein FtsY [Deltaproteobacteria bacterium]|nr:signal recognition particle-docking protein FtsY [Deltaproteobacteria bacterium]